MFEVMKKFKIFLSISIAIILVGIVCLIINRGFVTDIDFSGGAMLQIDMEQKEYTEEDISAIVKEKAGVEPYSVQKVEGGSQVMIKMESIDGEKRTAIFEGIKEKYGLSAEAPLASDNVSPAVSSDIVYNAVLAVIIACVLILIYITIRFEFSSGVAAVLALLHDTLIMLAFYAIFRFPVNSSFIAAILTIIGYSINNTIILFDRIRENRRFAKKETFSQICEKSIWQTMRRTLNTTGTTLVSLIVLYIMGADSIKEFALPLIIGMIGGTYSSVLLAAPFWNLIHGGDKKKKVKTA